MRLISERSRLCQAQSLKCVFESWFPISCFLYKTFHIIKIHSASLQFICGQSFQQILLRPPPVRQTTWAVDSAAHHLPLKKNAGGSNITVCQICCSIWRIFVNFSRFEINTINTIKNDLKIMAVTSRLGFTPVASLVWLILSLTLSTGKLWIRTKPKEI